jgi:hypothetical protein
VGRRWRGAARSGIKSSHLGGWVGGLCDEHVEEGGGGGGGAGTSDAEPTSGLEGERGLG